MVTSCVLGHRDLHGQPRSRFDERVDAVFDLGGDLGRPSCVAERGDEYERQLVGLGAHLAGGVHEHDHAAPTARRSTEVGERAGERRVAHYPDDLVVERFVVREEPDRVALAGIDLPRRGPR